MEDYKKLLQKIFTNINKVNITHYNDCIKIFQKNSLNLGIFDPFEIISKLQHGMKNWFGQQTLGDTILIFQDGRKIHCHRCILEKNSFFKKIIQSLKNEECIEIKMEILQNPNYDLIYLIIEYLYTGSFDLKSFEEKKMDVLLLHQLSKELKCEFIEEICTGELSFHSIQGNHLKMAFQHFEHYFLVHSISEMDQFQLHSGMVNLIAPFDMETEEMGFIQAHKSYLAQRSEYFKLMFNSLFSESSSSNIEILEISILTLSKIIQYLYSGVLPEVTSDICVEFYLSVHKFELKELIPFIRSIIKEQMEDLESACALLEISHSIDDSYMFNFCLHLLTKNYESIQEMKSFQLLDNFLKSEILKSFVKRNS
jgi:hypothetical protein